MAIIGFGAVLKIGGTTLDEGVMIKCPSMEGSVAETTNLTSSNRTRTYIPGLLNPGQFSFELNYNKSDYSTLLTNINTLASFEIDAPADSSSASATLTFNAILTKVELEFEADKVAQIKAEGQVSGPITLA